MPDLEAQRGLLLSAITDIGRSVSSNDQKASAALVVHGLLFAGVTAISTRLGSLYGHAHQFERQVGRILLLVALVFFVCSVASLLVAISPYRPYAVDADLGDDYRRVYFPDLHDLVASEPAVGHIGWYLARLRGSSIPTPRRGPFRTGRSRGARSPLLRAMALRAAPLSSEEVNRELMAEVLKLKDILDWEGRWAQRGYRLLAVELLFICAFFVLVLIVATRATHGWL